MRCRAYRHCLESRLVPARYFGQLYETFDASFKEIFWLCHGEIFPRYLGRFAPIFIEQSVTEIDQVPFGDKQSAAEDKFHGLTLVGRKTYRASSMPAGYS